MLVGLILWCLILTILGVVGKEKCLQKIFHAICDSRKRKFAFRQDQRLSFDPEDIVPYMIEKPTSAAIPTSGSKQRSQHLPPENSPAEFEGPSLSPYSPVQSNQSANISFFEPAYMPARSNIVEIRRQSNMLIVRHKDSKEGLSPGSKSTGEEVVLVDDPPEYLPSSAAFSC